MKRYIIIFSFFFSLFGIIGLFKYSIIPAMNDEMLFPSDKVVIIDAGHGGFDGGAVADDGTMEKDINLKTALKLNDLLLLNGYDTIMIREDDVSVEESNAKNKKKSDIHQRLNVAHQCQQAIFLSIHQNSFVQRKSHGAQTFYGIKNDKSLLLAEIIQKNIINLVQTDNTRAIKKADKNLFLLTNIKNPCVLIECGFITNPQELIKLKDDEYQQRLMFAVMDSLDKFYEETEVETVGED